MTDYQLIRSALVPNSADSYNRALGDFHNWFVASTNFMVTHESPSTWTPSSRTAVYSTALWQMVKLWEINQEFGLEGMPQVPFGATANPRGWAWK